MVRHAAKQFPSTVFEQPSEGAGTSRSINMSLGSVNVSLGGPAGTGVYRTTTKNGPGIQTEGIRDGVRNLLGRVKEGVDRIGIQ